MKVNHFQSYQAVRFAKGIETFFTPTKFPGISMVAGEIGIHLKHTDSAGNFYQAIIPYTNIAYFEPATETVVKPVSDIEPKAAKK